MKNNTYTKYVASLSNTVLSLSEFKALKPTSQQIRLPTLAEIEDYHTRQGEPKPPKPKRKKITSFSPASRRRLVRYAREIPKDRFTGFITLTYPNTPDVLMSKEHINQFLEMMRREANSEKFSALWVMEFQERGAVHYHIWTNSWLSKAKITKSWNRIIGATPETPSTNVRTWKAYSKNGLSSYVAKYARKQLQKELPEELDGAGRWWGKVGDVSTPLAVKVEVTKEQRDIIKADALNRGWKEIESEWCRLFIVDENDREGLFKFMETIKNDTEKIQLKSEKATP